MATSGGVILSYSGSSFCPKALVTLVGLGINHRCITVAHPDLTVSHHELPRLCRRYHVKRLALFGSAARDDFGPSSDIDVLVEFQSGKEPSLGGLFRMQEEASHIFGGRYVHIATPSILKNPYRRKSILRDLEPLYGT